MLRVTGQTAVVTGSNEAFAARGSHELRPWLPALLVGAVLACLAALALATLLALTSPRIPPAAHGLSSLPITLTPNASASIGASERMFWPIHRGASLLTQGGGIHSTFTASGAALRVAQGTIGLSLTGVGRGQRLDPVAPVAPTAAANQVLYRHGSISEFYRDGPYGLEQGFTVRHRPTAGEGALVLALSVAGSLVPRRVGSQIVFRTHSDATVLRYGQLSALDATGRRLPAHMQLSNGTLQLRIDDSSARYPLRIDPFVQQGGKLATGELDGFFGGSVALSSDGSTALIGACDGHGRVGAAWVFTRSGSTWSQGEKLTATNEIGGACFGISVGLSREGNTALIGGRDDNNGAGAAWVFTRSGATWAQGEKLTGSGETQNGDFGASVALSGDGDTALIGGIRDGSFAGAAWVFTRSASTWTQQGSKLTASDESNGKYGGDFAASVALSDDGNTALIGGGNDNEGAGAAWAFTRSSSTWSQQGSKLTASDASGPYGSAFGSSVALSGDGNTALIGGGNDNEGAGAAWAFTRSESIWSQREKLTGSEEIGKGRVGYSVALSADGNTALVGGPADDHRVLADGSVGAAWVFVNPPAVVTTADQSFGAGGGMASTANENGTSADDPLATSVTTHVEGEVTINEATTTATSTTYTLLGQQVTISAPQASVAQPLVLAFDLDPSLLSAAGADPATVTVFRDGAPIADCANASGTATPDPCVSSRTMLGNGALRLTVLSSHASSWTFGVRKPYAFRGFLSPVKNAPAVNAAKAGSSLPVKFSLGGFQGTLIYAEGSPTLREVPRLGSTGCASNLTDRSGTPLAATLTTYDRSGGTYTLAIKSAKSWAGTCRQLNMRLADGTWHQALFRFS
jgi:hypothetical protein